VGLVQNLAGKRPWLLNSVVIFVVRYGRRYEGMVMLEEWVRPIQWDRLVFRILPNKAINTAAMVAQHFQILPHRLVLSVMTDRWRMTNAHLVPRIQLVREL
jgi:hypothetical protein